MQAAEYKFVNGYRIPVHVLVQKHAETCQLSTQRVGMRTLCVVITIVGIDEEKGPQVFKIDPAGFCMGYKAIAAGAKEQEAINHLEKVYKKKKDGWELNEAIQTAIGTLQSVIGSDFKSSELEVGVATVDRSHFVKLSTEDIDFHLNAIADAN